MTVENTHVLLCHVFYVYWDRCMHIPAQIYKTCQQTHIDMRIIRSGRHAKFRLNYHLKARRETNIHSVWYTFIIIEWTLRCNRSAASLGRTLRNSDEVWQDSPTFIDYTILVSKPALFCCLWLINPFINYYCWLHILKQKNVARLIVWPRRGNPFPAKSISA